MSILMNKHYIIKWSTNREGVQNAQKSVYRVYGWPLEEEDTTESFHVGMYGDIHNLR